MIIIFQLIGTVAIITAFITFLGMKIGMQKVREHEQALDR